MEGIFLLHLFVSLMMVGLIWFVQLVHYPLFHCIEPDSFPLFEKKHQQLTGYLVAPLMLCELLTAFLLIWMHPLAISLSGLWVNLVLLMLIWASTFFIQVPLHQRLTSAFSVENIRKLVNSNWIRTLLWTLRGGILIYLLNES